LQCRRPQWPEYEYFDATSLQILLWHDLLSQVE
jgi:hypothetical protein